MDTHKMHIDGQANIANTSNSENSSISSISSDLENSRSEDVTNVDNVNLDELHAEVAKWQERVPKLAAALRVRTEELASVRQELRAAQNAKPATDDVTGESSDARLQARDQLITELQQKITSLTERHRTAASELHVSQLDLTSATEEAKGWQEKWHSVTSSLDTSVADASRSSSELEQAKQKWAEQETELGAAHAEELTRTQRETESLRVRNANLQETVEFANKQIEGLGEDMTMLVEQGKSNTTALEEAALQITKLTAAEEAVQQRAGILEAEAEQRQVQLDAVNTELKEAQTESESQLEQVKRLEQQATEIDEVLAQQSKEFEKRLEDEDQRYAAAMQAADDEQTQLAKQLDAKDEVAAEIKAELESERQHNTTQTEEMATLRRSLTSGNEKLEESELVVQAKQNQIKTLESEQLKLTESLSEVKQAADESQSTFVELNLEMQKLVQQVDTLQAERETSESRAEVESNNAAEQIHALNTALEDAHKHAQDIERTESAATTELEKLRSEQERWTTNEQDLLAQVNEIEASSQQQLREQATEIERLSECVDQAQGSQTQGEQERGELAGRVSGLEDENARLKSNLEERSNLVRELEEERRKSAALSGEVGEEQDRLAKQLAETQHRFETSQEHADSLEAKRENQQGLMSELEVELSELQEESVAALKGAEQARREAQEESRKVSEQLTKLQDRCDDLAARNGELLEQANSRATNSEALAAEVEREQNARLDQQNAVHSLQAELHGLAESHAQEIAVLQAQIKEYDSNAKSHSPTVVLPEERERLQELEQLLRERTEELDNMRWRSDQAESATDDNVVMILNQQLNDAREENKRLLDKIASAKSEGQSRAPGQSQSQPQTESETKTEDDDLTVLKGIGVKLAKQLTALGVTRLSQIAELDETALEQEDHVLHAFRSRILRDDWISQAQETLSD